MPPPCVSLRGTLGLFERDRRAGVVISMDVISTLLSYRCKGAPAGGAFRYRCYGSQRADQRSRFGRCGTGVLTFTVTWYSRICSETDRSGERVAKRACLKSFICPPSRRLVVVARQATPRRSRCQGVTKFRRHLREWRTEESA